MFDPSVLSRLASASSQVFKQLAAIEDALNERFSGLQDPIRALILAVAAGEPLLLIGPPGTAKSRLIRAFCGLVGLVQEDDLSADHPLYFEYLLTPFTEPGELFGFYNIAAARENKLVRDDTGMMQHAKVVYLDEVFNGSSAILNSILAFLNERIFHDRGVRKQVAMECLFGATNQLPDTAELRAVFDRFVLRCHLDNAPADNASISDLVSAGWTETYGRKAIKTPHAELLEKLGQLRETIRGLTRKGIMQPKQEDPFYNGLTQLIQHARQYDLSDMSNRRIVKMVYIMVMHRLYTAVRSDSIGPALTMGREQLQLIPSYFLDRTDEEAIRKMERTVST